MARGIFCAVAFSEDAHGALASAVETHFRGTSYQLTPSTFLVFSEDSADDVALALGLLPADDDTPPPLGEGIVFSVNGSYTGYAAIGLGGWIRAFSE